MNPSTSGIDKAIGLAGALLLAVTGTARAGERVVRASAVPAAVREAVQGKYPEAKVVGYTREEEGGKVSYELNVRVQGRAIDVVANPDGRILAVEERIATDELPAAVAQAFAASVHGRGKVKRIERIVENDDQTKPCFEILVAQRRAQFEMTFDAAGTLLKEERLPP